MNVLLMPFNDPMRYKYMKEALDECDDIKTFAVKMIKGNGKINKILFIIKGVFNITICDAVVFSNGINRFLFKTCLLFQKKIIIDMYVSNYETNILTRKMFNENSREAQDILEWERFVLKNSQKVIYLNNAERDYYLSVSNSTHQHAYVLPLFIENKSEAKLSFWQGRESEFNICWWGAENNPIHGLENIANALDILFSKGVCFNLFIFGSNKDEGSEYYNSFFGQRKWRDRVTIRYDLTFHNGKLEKYLQEYASVALGPLSDETKARTVITNKALDAISMKIPLITIESMGMKEHFDDDMVYYCNDAKPRTIADRIMDVLYSSKEEIEIHVNRAKSKFLCDFDIQELKKQFIDILMD